MSNQSELDELRKIVKRYDFLKTEDNPEGNPFHPHNLSLDETVEVLLNWHNKQVEEVLDRLDKSMPTPEQLTTKYGYHMPEKQYGYKLGLHDIRDVIETERAKLEEVK